MRWHRMEDEEVDELWEKMKPAYGPRVASFVFFLTEASDDFMVYQGDVYRRVEEK